jgi:hypothetical protein
MAGITHIAGLDITVNTRVRQRCGWCGAVLIDDDLAHIMVPVGQDATLPRWPVGGLVLIDGNASVLVDHNDGDQLPADACGRIDPDVTT